MSYITLEQAKDHLRVDFSDDDPYIETLIEVAETSILNDCKAYTIGNGTVTTNGTTTLTGDDDTTFLDYKAGDVIRVFGETVRTISSITDNDTIVVSAAFSTSKTGLSYQVEQTPIESGVLPKPLFQAVLLLIGHLYENREPVIVGVGVQKMPLSIEYLIAPYKNWVCR